jgi:hypothetical protein
LHAFRLGALDNLVKVLRPDAQVRF